MVWQHVGCMGEAVPEEVEGKEEGKGAEYR